MLLAQLRPESYCPSLSSTSSSLGFQCRKKKWTDFNVIFAPTLPVPLPREARCRFLSATWRPSPFVPYTCPSTPWWHGALPKHGLGLHAQELHLHEAAQAGHLADVPPNPMAHLYELCVQHPRHSWCPSHGHPSSTIQFLWEDEVRSVKPGVDSRCILKTPFNKKHLRCILTSQITLNLLS